MKPLTYTLPKALTFKEAFKKVVSENITSRFDLDEYKSVQYQDKAYNNNFPKFYGVVRFSINTFDQDVIDVMLENGFVDNGTFNKSSVKVNINGESFDIDVHTASAPINGSVRCNVETTPKINGTIKAKIKSLS